MVFLVFGWIAMVFAAAAFFQFLWNTTVPQIFGLRTIRYWQSFRLLLMAAMLTGPTFFRFNINR